MKRRDFLRKFGIGVSALSVAPLALHSEEKMRVLQFDGVDIGYVKESSIQFGISMAETSGYRVLHEIRPKSCMVNLHG